MAPPHIDLEPLLDLFELPVELRAALDPPEVAHDDANDRLGGAVELREADWRRSCPGFAALGIFTTVRRAAD
jgi:hypothetical protein